MDEEDIDSLSYKKLHKMIVENHPVDPDTHQKFKISERITVKDYNKKLFDVCCILKCLKL